MTFQDVLTKYRTQSFSTRDQGDRFEHLMKRYLMTDPKYASEFKRVDLWMEFYARDQFGGIDTGIDLVAETQSGEYWAIQCKCYKETDRIDKDEVNKFLGTYGKTFTDRDGNPGTGFSQGLWISTVPASNWSSTASEALNNQRIPVSRINLADLERAPVDWNKLEEGTHGIAARMARYNVLQHQQTAIDNAKKYFGDHDRGKMIMACGTGKTFVSLKISEELRGPNNLILFLAPSIALVGQTLREWTAQCKSDIHPICVCSDPKITKQRKKNDDDSGDRIIDLGLPATTDPSRIMSDYRTFGSQQTTVIFSTYQSIEVLSDAQKMGLPVFDLIVCDEAHRTTGVRLAEDKEKAFTMVHDDNYIRGLKRLYMTATPRIYSENAKKKAEDGNIIMRSMDDESLFGSEFYRIGFGDAVEKGLLSDYKVMILTVNESMIPPDMAGHMYDVSSQIDMDAALKLMGCISALSKIVEGDDSVKTTDPGFMHSAVAFCNTIKMSEDVANWFNNYSRKYLEIIPDRYNGQIVKVSGRTVSSQMSMPDREENLAWLKDADTEDDRCRIVTNVRCLSEGVDVPALDAVMFLSAKNSQIDVVQSVGRVMRKPRMGDKKFGYIIIPIIADPQKTPNEALEDNDNYKVVWTVLNALRAHDERLENVINKLDLMSNRGGSIVIGGPGGSGGGGTGGIQTILPLDLDGWQEALYAKIVKKVGNRMYWSDWAKDVGKLAIRTMATIDDAIEKPECKPYFESFISELRTNIHDSIDRKQAVEMLAQHLITQPIFESLFEDYSFSKHNPVSRAMDSMIDILVRTDQSINDFKSLDKFYEQVKKRVEKIDNARGKQTVILELYNNFFQAAFPKMADKLGIVYTPVEIVDFIINSVNDVIKTEFNCDLSDENVTIIDPFTGTGTFITRLLQSGLISAEDLPRKYTYEIFANEIVLLAYYIASVNIESTYHEIMGDESYAAFDGLCLTDTFDKIKSNIESAHIFTENKRRISRMVNAPINVIIGNPPYSVGQESTNDNNKNQSYPEIDKKIADTYVKLSPSTNKNRIYDGYIRAFRYATDRIGNRDGIICFVSNGGWLDGSSSDGLRLSLEREFYKIYVFNLRGNARTKGELRRKEAGNVFGEGSKTTITILLLIKKADYNGKATIYYSDIGDYLSKSQKLKIIKDLGSFSNPAMDLEILEPGEEGDWITPHNELFRTFIPLDATKKFEQGESVFLVNSIGYNTSRDPWMINFSKKELEENVKRLIDFYNTQTPQNKSNDKTKIAWSRSLLNSMMKGVKINFDQDKIESIMYRPFTKSYFYNEKELIEMNYLNRRIFPDKNSENLVISVNGKGRNVEFGVFISNIPMNIQCMPNGQCFPLYYYTEKSSIKYSKNKQLTLIPDNAPKQMRLDDGLEQTQAVQYTRQDGVSDWFHLKAVNLFGKDVTKTDLFYYIYGLLHSRDYRMTFSGDLKRGLPRIPLIEDKKGFWAFVNAGRALADLHINYESQEPWPDVIIDGDLTDCKIISKMKFESKEDKSTILINGHLSLKNVPLRAYEYTIAGTSAIEWIMDRYQVKVEPNSKIKNDPNLYSIENNDPQYIVNLLRSVITVSMKTLDIQDSLPKLVFKDY